MKTDINLVIPESTNSVIPECFCRGSIFGFMLLTFSMGSRRALLAHAGMTAGII